MEKNTVIYIPGFTYTSKGPIEVDKIEAFASINEEEYPIYQLGKINNTIERIDIKSKKLNTSDTSKKININGIITRPLKQSFLEKDPYEVDEDSSVMDKLLTDYYSESARSKRIIRGRFIDIVDEDEKEKKYKHTISYVYDTAEPIVENFNYNEHDGLFYILVDKLDTDITFTFKLYTFIGEEYVYIGEKTIFYNPVVDGTLIPKFVSSFEPLFYDTTIKDHTGKPDKSKTIHIEYPNNVLFLDKNNNIFRFKNRNEGLVKLNTDSPVNLNNLVRYIYPAWEINTAIEKAKNSNGDEYWRLGSRVTTAGEVNLLNHKFKTAVKLVLIVPNVTKNPNNKISNSDYFSKLDKYFLNLKNNIKLNFDDLTKCGIFLTLLKIARGKNLNFWNFHSEHDSYIKKISEDDMDFFWLKGKECGGLNENNAIYNDVVKEQVSTLGFKNLTGGRNDYSNSFWDKGWKMSNGDFPSPGDLYFSMTSGIDGMGKRLSEFTYKVFGYKNGMNYLLNNPLITILNASNIPSKILLIPDVYINVVGYVTDVKYHKTDCTILYNDSERFIKNIDNIFFTYGNNPFSVGFKDTFDLTRDIEITARCTTTTNSFIFNNAQLFADYDNSRISFPNGSDFSLLRIINIYHEDDKNSNFLGYFDSQYAKPNINTTDLLIKPDLSEEKNKTYRYSYPIYSTFIEQNELFWISGKEIECEINVNSEDKDKSLSSDLNGVYVFHINYFELDGCDVLITLNTEKEKYIFDTKNLKNKNKIVFYAGKTIRINSFIVKVTGPRSYIKNFGLFYVPISDSSNYVNILLESSKPTSPTEKIIQFEEQDSDCPFKYVVLPACYAYIENNIGFYDKKYNGCALPDEPYIQVVQRYKLNLEKNKFKGEVDDSYPSMCGSFDYSGNIRKLRHNDTESYD